MNLSLNKLIGQRPDLQYGKTERHTPDWLFILWMGGTALLSYSLVYALRKPFTAAEFEGLTVAGMDYKIVVSIIQLIGYVCAKLFGIKYFRIAAAESVEVHYRICCLVRSLSVGVRPVTIAL